jgi:DNA-binding GntR family transcriptional regulator
MNAKRSDRAGVASLEGGRAPAEASEGLDSEAVYNSIKAMITSGELASGAAVSQLDLTKKFGVSRTPIREALRRLQAEGLLDAQRNRRMRVSAITPDELDSIYAMRIFLESMGIALSVPHMTAADLEELQAASQAINWSYDRSAEDIHDHQLSRFKWLAMKYAGDAVRTEVANLFNRCERIRKIYQVVSPGSLTVAQDEHRALMRAITSGATEDAVFVASRHLGRTALAVLGYMAPDYEPRAVRFALMQTGRPLPQQASTSVLNVIGDGPVSRVGGRGAPVAGRNKASR